MNTATLRHWRPDADAVYVLAGRWVDEHPAAVRLPAGRWQELVMVGVGAGSPDGMHAAFRDHLENSKSKRGPNRWSNPALTAELLRVIDEADKMLESSLPDYLVHEWAELKAADAAAGKTALDNWRREQVWIFLKAVIRIIQGRSRKDANL